MKVLFWELLWGAIFVLISSLSTHWNWIDIGSLVGSFFGLLIPGLITIIGSYGLYLKRQDDNRVYLRCALQTELRQMGALKNLSAGLDRLDTPPPAGDIPASKLPPSGVLPTKIYDGNVEKLGLLEEDIQRSVVEFYSELTNIKAIIDEIRSGNQVPDADHKEIYEKIPSLHQKREQLLSKLDSDS